jgi:hypothetical protein
VKLDRLQNFAEFYTASVDLSRSPRCPPVTAICAKRTAADRVLTLARTAFLMEAASWEWLGRQSLAENQKLS